MQPELIVIAGDDGRRIVRQPGRRIPFQNGPDPGAVLRIAAGWSDGCSQHQKRIATIDHHGFLDPWTSEVSRPGCITARKNTGLTLRSWSAATP